MAHLGALTLELSGHLNPMTSLGRELARRGHSVTFYGRAAGRAKVEGAGLRFRAFAEQEYPPGGVDDELKTLAKLGGIKALRHTAEVIRRRTVLCLRDVPAMARADGIDGMLVDQVTPEGATIAQEMGVPFVTVCNALALHQESSVPPFFTTWRHARTAVGRCRNRLAYRAVRWLVSPIVEAVNTYRRGHGLAPLDSFQDAHSPWLQLSQQPAEFDFPGRRMPPSFRYTGPFVDPGARGACAFPSERLDETRPLIYASMGTLQNGQAHVFSTIAAACAGLGAQVVISLGGGGKPEDLPRLDGEPIVVGAAPQLELLKRATLCVTHAGLNTALESLAEGVPMVAIPVTNDQPGVAARIRHVGCGEVVPLKKLNVARLRRAVVGVMGDGRYRENARRIRDAIARRDGLREAADAVEGVLRAPAAPAEVAGKPAR
jgi:zeaxanthin glucosyltransferase